MYVSREKSGINQLNMSFALMSIIEILLFNVAFILIYQPAFVFKLLRMSEESEKRSRNIMMAGGVVVLCILFGWSFYFGATLSIYKQSLL